MPIHVDRSAKAERLLAGPISALRLDSPTVDGLRKLGFERAAIRPVHDRMPVLLMPDEYEQWLHASFDDALTFQQRCFPDELIEMTRTDELWVKRQPTEGALI